MQESREGEGARSCNMWDARNVWDWDKERQRYEEALERERAEAYAEAYAEGFAIGRAQMSQLILKLIEDGRFEELGSDISDLELQEQLMLEYGIE